MVKSICALALVLGACGKFEDPAIVIDLRALSMVAQPPEQLIPYTPTMPPDPTKLHLAPFYVGALIADPQFDRPLQWQMTACPPTSNDRCDPKDPSVLFAGGTMTDPDQALSIFPGPIGRLDPGPDLLAVVEQAVKSDPQHGFTSIDFMVELRVWFDGAYPDQAIYAAKGLRFGSEDPPGRTPNQNPHMSEVDWRIGPATGDAPLVLPPALCADSNAVQFPVVAPGDTAHFSPIEADGARETYVVPTFDGGSDTLTENLSYDWFAGAGSFDPASSGGPVDPFGNQPKLGTDWTAPDDQIEQYVPIYVVQRDERLGQSFYTSCVHVMP